MKFIPKTLFILSIVSLGFRLTGSAIRNFNWIIRKLMRK